MLSWFLFLSIYGEQGTLLIMEGMATQQALSPSSASLVLPGAELDAAIFLQLQLGQFGSC